MLEEGHTPEEIADETHFCLDLQRFAVKLNQSRHGYARLVQEVLSEEKHA